MRKIGMITLILCFLLQPVTGKAQAYNTIGELRESIPERWTQTYETKWRTVDIDVQPIVPNVADIPLLQVMKDNWIPDISALGEGWSSRFSEQFWTFGVQLGDLSTKGDNKDESEPFFDPPYDLEHRYGKNSDLTLGDTIGQLKYIMEKLGDAPDAWQFDQPRELHTYICLDKKTGKPLYPDLYIYVVKQQLHGLPLFSHVMVGIENPRDQEPRVAVGDIMFRIRSPELCAVAGSKVKITEVIADDIPVCDFSLVQASLEKEIQDGHIRKIFDLELGYVLYNTPDPAKPLSSKTLVLYAVPTWQVHCFYMTSGKREMSDHSNPNVSPFAIAQMEYKTVFVNAQTGEVIDRLDNRIGCGNYKGFISWDDVGGKP